MSDEGASERAVGLQILGFYEGRLVWAADALGELPLADTAGLKVRSGEHLAALVMSAILGTCPVGFDRTGEADLTYEMVEAGREFEPGRHEVEVKSLPGEFRPWQARNGRDLGNTFEVELVAVSAIVEAIEGSVAAAAKGAVRRASNATQHAFVVAHMFDHLAPDMVNDRFVGAVLPKIDLPAPIESVWVLWWPAEVTLLRRGDEAWTQVVFYTDPEVLLDDLEEPLYDSEARLLKNLGIDVDSSPFRVENFSASYHPPEEE